ncbi:hypothetical protein ANCDUO_06804 [Ancylostoma duodenale]|uniref:G-protein coupled receptors family 1 profile domain-containing protein n=1 Tax=Ancylostoma duodenale TaxID=51022 RepID=A0A0C2GNM7_9BILA|nr:hypothetical protein ANCDUO_06804 [Ancylostoma duodenale]
MKYEVVMQKHFLGSFAKRSVRSLQRCATAKLKRKGMTEKAVAEREVKDLRNPLLIAGIVLNTLLLLSFSRLQFRNTNLLYLFLLAVFDIFVELSFMVSFEAALNNALFSKLEMYLSGCAQNSWLFVDGRH